MTDIDLDMPFRVPLRRCPVRLLNGLESIGCNTLRDVLRLSEVEIIGIRMVGEFCLHALKTQLANMGMEVGQERNRSSAPAPSETKTLRDEFAGQALAGMMANCSEEMMSRSEGHLAEMAYRHANAMIAEKRRRESSK